MMTIIAKIIICMIAAALLGFIIGWIFSSLLRNEKHEKQITAVKERFDEQKAQINQLETDMGAKEKELIILKEEYATVQKEILSREMDSEDNSIDTAKMTALLEENKMLTAQIKEQQICENANKALQEENQKLKEKIEALNEVEASYKENILRIAELESDQQKETPMMLEHTLEAKIKTLTDENSALKKSMKSQQVCETEKELLLNEIEELLKEKQSLIDNIESIKNGTAKAKKKKDTSAKSISSTICHDTRIIEEEDLHAMGLKEDKISKVIKNLFSDTKKSK